MNRRRKRSLKDELKEKTDNLNQAKRLLEGQTAATDRLKAALFYAVHVLYDGDARGILTARDTYNTERNFKKGSWDGFIALDTQGHYQTADEYLEAGELTNGARKLQEMIRVERELGVDLTDIAKELVDPVKKMINPANGYK